MAIAVVTVVLEVNEPRVLGAASQSLERGEEALARVVGEVIQHVGVPIVVTAGWVPDTETSTDDE